ncbi:hypothetical protein DW657_10000 [Prevotella sp. AM23-5]|uniref:hypothetical protein n=1 Tax=Prevotellaceae TaxID=171552 RepID=UPI000E47F3AC|nr:MULTISPECIES: hypothetical protein [Prevotellaceae]RHN93130.1 hypothetical protein DW657_10000 [Prevotella sp. AM23-5]
MAIVNVDLSEYDAIRKRNSELEEQVKELKKLNDSLKQGAKVILRKETVVEVNVPRPRYGRFEPGFDMEEKPTTRRTIESSESYVNFEDVRLKVENAMQNEVKRSIYDRDCERRAYADEKNKLDGKYNGMKADLKKTYEKKEKDLEAVYQDKERDLREKYASMTGEFEAKRLRILNKLPKIATMATDLRDELNKCFFKPKLAIKLANDIIDFSIKKE